jgi:E3 ubiquitin-protein ligase ZSWIM2
VPEAAAGVTEVEQRPVADDEVCPICQEAMGDEGSLTFCRRSCGNNVHIKCMKVWAEHRTSLGENVTCPLCRKDWGPLALHELKRQSDVRRRTSDIHRGVACKGCRTLPIHGTNYRCVHCRSYDLCTACFNGGTHSHHAFVMRRLTTDAWVPAVREDRHAAAVQRLAIELQSRELSSADYDTLLSLDHRPDSVPLYVHLATLLPEATPGVGVACVICDEPLSGRTVSIGGAVAGCSAKRLPCLHEVHSECLRTQLANEEYDCARDGTPIFKGLSSRTLAGAEGDADRAGPSAAPTGAAAIRLRRRRAPSSAMAVVEASPEPAAMLKFAIMGVGIAPTAGTAVGLTGADASGDAWPRRIGLVAAGAGARVAAAAGHGRRIHGRPPLAKQQQQQQQVRVGGIVDVAGYSDGAPVAAQSQLRPPEGSSAIAQPLSIGGEAALPCGSATPGSAASKFAEVRMRGHASIRRGPTFARATRTAGSEDPAWAPALS